MNSSSPFFAVAVNLQRRALLALDADIPSSSRPNTFIPHDAVMAATKAVTDGAKLALKRDKRLFKRRTKQHITPKASTPSVPTFKSVSDSSHATSITASISSSGSATPVTSNIRPKENVVATCVGPAATAKLSPPKLGALEFAARRAMLEQALSTYAAMNGVQQRRKRQNSITCSAA